MAQSAISRNPNPALDLLRVLAAAMVLLVHAGQAAGLDSVTWVGGNGVLLFFILSGCLTMASLDRQSQAGGPTMPAGRGASCRCTGWCWRCGLSLTRSGIWPAACLRARCSARTAPVGRGICATCSFCRCGCPARTGCFGTTATRCGTMSAFAFFYLLAPWLHRLLEVLGRRFAAGRFLGQLCAAARLPWAAKACWAAPLSKTLNALPAGSVDNISEFSAKNPPMELYAFLFGVTLFYAVKEGRGLLYGGFCLLLPMAFGFERMAWRACSQCWCCWRSACPAGCGRAAGRSGRCIF